MAPRSTLPPLPFGGRCQCGAVSYRITAPPLAFYLCHCTECQKQSASAFGESLQLATDGAHFSGILQRFTRRADSGRDLDCYFCPSCGTRVYHRNPGAETLTVKAGTLDDRSWLVPAGHIWARSRQPWVRFGADELVFEKGAQKGALRARWRAMTDA